MTDTHTTQRDRRQMLAEILRYGVVAVIGLGIDVSIGYAAHALAGLPLTVGAALGFLVGVATNYVLFEKWVFQGHPLSWLRLGKAYVAAQGAMVVRIACVWGLTPVLASLPKAALLTLMAAAGISFLVNFVLVRLFLKPKTTVA